MMADMHEYDPKAALADTGDDFADDIAGDAYSSPNRPYAAHGRGPGQGLAGIARNQLLGLADNGKSEFVRSLEGIVGLVREVAAQVEGLGVEPLSVYARRATSLVDDIHGGIANKSVEDLIDDGRDLVRQQPEIAIAAAMIIGFVGARIMRART